MANNHIFDYGSNGLIDTINLLKKEKIEFVGAGENLSDAIKTKQTKINGKNVSFINITENEWSVACEKHGGAHPIDIIENTYKIKKAKRVSDIVILIIHGGHELYSLPSPRMVKLYRYFAEMGASAVIGHHTHVPSGYEVYNNVPIFYGLGNLIFPPMNSNHNISEWKKGYIVQLIINENNGIQFKLYPYKYTGSSIRKMVKDERKTFMDQLLYINSVIENPELLKNKWDKYVESRHGTIARLSIPWVFIRKAASKLKIEEKLIDKKQIAYMLNIFRCESHRDVALQLLNNSIK